MATCGTFCLPPTLGRSRCTDSRTRYLWQKRIGLICTLLHVAPQPGVVLPEPMPGVMPVVDPSEVTVSTRQRLRALIPEGTQLWHEPTYMVQFGSPAEMIVRIAAPAVDLIVLGVKRPTVLTKHLSEGVAYKVVCYAPCPVLSVGAWYHV